MEYDVIIIGAGIVGASIARHLSRFDLNIVWIDKASDVGTAASSANSAIVHSGHDPLPGTLKARMNKRGNSLWEIWCKELNIPFKRTGSLVVALQGQDTAQLDHLLDRSRQNGIAGVEIWPGERVREWEPLVNPEVHSALWTPTAALIDPFDAVLALAENAVCNGVELRLLTKFEGFIIQDQQVQGIVTGQGEIYAPLVINCAGIFSDFVMHQAGVREEFYITPRRGEYFVFDPQAVQVSTVLFPLPTEKGKGALVTTTLHGNTMIGPSADSIDDKEDTSTTRQGMDYILEHACLMVPGLSSRDIIAGYSGIRATGSLRPKDFLIETALEVQGLINVAGIESPGLASAPAIAEEVASLIQATGIPLTIRNDWNPYRAAPLVFKTATESEQKQLIKKDPLFGHVVCRCELVTEAEIVRAIHAVIPARDYDAVKRRCWLGTGRCQGSFDYPRILEILARELGQDITQVSKKGPGSEFIIRRTKNVEQV